MEEVDKKGDNLVPTVIAILALIFSIITHYQILPLNEANIIVSGTGIEILNEKSDQIIIDKISPNFVNIGKSSAKNLRFKIYQVPFDGKRGEVLRRFDDVVVQDVQPNENIDFGYFSNETKGGDISNPTILPRVALVFHLEYCDDLSDRYKNKVFMYHYRVGTSKVGTLVGADYYRNSEEEPLSVEERFEMFLKNEEASTVQSERMRNYLLKYIRNEPTDEEKCFTS